MFALKITITKYISDHQPGFVECSFVDVFNKEHIIQDKVPILVDKYLDATSDYPQEGKIACGIINKRQNPKGQKILKINISRPWGVETIEGLTDFEVLEEQLTDIKPSAVGRSIKIS